MSEGETAGVTVTFAGSGDAFGSGGRLQACIHLSADADTVYFSTAARPAWLQQMQVHRTASRRGLFPPFTRVVDRGRLCKGRYLRGCTRARIGAAATTVNGVARGKSSSSDVMRACRTIVANARVASSMAK